MPGRFALFLLSWLSASASSVGAAALQPEGWQAPDPSVVRALTEHLNGWLDAHSDYPKVAAPGIAFVSEQEARMMRGSPGRSVATGRLRGLYDPDTETIFLVGPWDYGDLHDVSVLLHEIVHHRQQAARHWYCAAEQEEDAYRLQEAWLAGFGLDPGFYWPAIVLGSSCAPRDFHPD